MSNKIISKLTAGAEQVKGAAGETFQVAGKKAKKAGEVISKNTARFKKEATETVQETVEKIKAADKPSFADLKKDAEKVVKLTVTQVSAFDWKSEMERIKNLDFPVLNDIKAIDWKLEHDRMWAEKKSFSMDELPKDSIKVTWDTDTEPSYLLYGAGVGKTSVKIAPEGEVEVEDTSESETEDVLVYSTSSEGFEDKEPLPLVTGAPGGGKSFTKEQLLEQLAKDMNAVLTVEENKASFEDSKKNVAKEANASKSATKAKPKAAPKKAAKTEPKDTTVTVLGGNDGEVEPLGTEYKKLIRKTAKLAEKNPDTKLYLTGKTYGIGARGTVENVDGKEVTVFDVKDIKKLLAKIS